MRVHELHGFLTRFLVGLKELFENAVIERVAALCFVASGLDRSGLVFFAKAQQALQNTAKFNAATGHNGFRPARRRWPDSPCFFEGNTRFLSRPS